MTSSKRIQFFAASLAFLVAVKAYDFQGYGGEDQGDHQVEHKYHYPTPYGFGYGVQDHHKGLDFKQHESSDGHKVNGEYAVLLPDGRYQIVKYEADWKNGYHADVKYYGEAKYPTHSYKHHELEYGLGDASGSSYNNLGHGHEEGSPSTKLFVKAHH